MNPATGLCRACLRTIEEIVSWGSADEATQARILAAVAERRASRGRPPGDAPPEADQTVGRCTKPE